MFGRIKTPPEDAVVKKKALGRSRGRVTTKIHAAVDRDGKPRALVLSANTVHDVRGAIPLLKRFRAKTCTADLAYDSNPLRSWLRSRGIKPVIPSRRTRLVKIPIEKRLYRQRYKVEWFFHSLKRWRKVASRYEKRAQTFLGMVQIAAIGILAL